MPVPMVEQDDIADTPRPPPIRASRDQRHAGVVVDERAAFPPRSLQTVVSGGPARLT